MEDKIKTIEIDGVEFSFNANKSFEKDGHVYCRECGEQIDSEPLACLGSKKIIFGRRCKCDREEAKRKDEEMANHIRRLKEECFNTSRNLMGEVEELENHSPLMEDLKRSIIEFCNEEYDSENSYDEFDTLYPDLAHVGIAYTETPDGRNSISYELNLEEMSWSLFLDEDILVVSEKFGREGMTEEETIKEMIESVHYANFNDLVYIDSDELMHATGLALDDEGNIYDPLSKDLDNDGIADRYVHNFRDSDYFESTYDVDDNLHARNKGEKPSILGQIKEYKENQNKEDKEKEHKENDRER